MNRSQLFDTEDLIQSYQDQAVLATREAVTYRGLLLMALAAWSADRIQLERDHLQLRQIMGLAQNPGNDSEEAV